MDRVLHFLSEWISRAGDTTVWSWVITIAYAVTILLSLYYSKKLSKEGTPEKRFLWFCIAIFLFLMGINKQLDFQILFTMAGRFLSRHQGWFEHRRAIQAYFTIGILLCIVPAGCLILFKIRRIVRSSLMELFGVAILVLFALIRIGSINHIDAAASFEKHAISHIHGLELLGLIVILFALINHLGKRPRTSACRGRVLL